MLDIFGELYDIGGGHGLCINRVLLCSMIDDGWIDTSPFPALGLRFCI